MVYAVRTDLGFEPCWGATGELSFSNCPFRGLAVRHPEPVCALNHALIAGLLDRVGAARLCAHLQPDPGPCRVQISVTNKAGG